MRASARSYGISVLALVNFHREMAERRRRASKYYPKMHGVISTIANRGITRGSPPSSRRATTSVCSAHDRNRSATASSSESPTPCPSVSLTFLKPSRSRHRTAMLSCRPRSYQCVGGQFMKLGPIGKPCERIVVGHEGDLRFVAFALSDISAGAAVALESAFSKGWVAVDFQPDLTSIRLADRKFESKSSLPVPVAPWTRIGNSVFAALRASSHRSCSFSLT